jgi:hypothetical protein
MSFQLDVRTDLARLKRRLGAISKNVLPRAAVTALNKTAVNVRTAASRSISEQTGMRVGDVRKRIRIKRAARQRFEADVIGNTFSPNLINYVRRSQQNAQAFRRKKGRGKGRKFVYEGVVARAWRKKEVYPETFIGTTKTGKPLVFVRTGKARTPIKTVYGPSLPRTFVKRETETVMERTAAKRWIVNVEQEINFRLRKLGL